MEEDHEFVYLALERCKATLSDAMQARPQRPNAVTALASLASVAVCKSIKHRLAPRLPL